MIFSRPGMIKKISEALEFMNDLHNSKRVSIAKRRLNALILDLKRTNERRK